MRAALIIAALIISNSINPDFEYPISFGLSIIFFTIVALIVDMFDFIKN